MNNHIGKKVKEFREALDISQGEIEKRIGLTPTSYLRTRKSRRNR